MTKQEYFHSTPNDVYTRIEVAVKEIEQKQKAESQMVDYTAWLHGLYVQYAVASIMSKRAKYPKKPFSQKETGKIVVTEDMSDEQKAEITNILFANLEEMQGKFEAHKVMEGVD